MDSLNIQPKKLNTSDLIKKSDIFNLPENEDGS